MSSIYNRRVGNFTLSVIERDWSTLAGTFHGKESAIVQAVIVDKGMQAEWDTRLPFMREGDYRDAFGALKTEADINAFIERMNADDD